ncbi:acyl-CoA thioesterase [Litoribacillus peritrichatus]|uniref:Thioesterase n=1 Tax=Litoribacillus peritrichatus TaxID=718191 RepID=A0ABP7MEK5_9GAMM
MSRLQITFPDKIHFTTHQTVRIQDVNYRKHLGHDKIISMIHDARAAFLESIGESELVDKPDGYVLADMQIIYLDEAFYKDELRFDIAVDEVSNRSCQIYYQISKQSSSGQGPQVITRAKTSVVFYNYQLKSAIPVPESIRTLTTQDETELTEA